MNVAGVVQFVSFRLADAMPVELIQRWKSELCCSDNDEQKRVLQRRIERYVDLGYGECHLRNPVIAEMVENSLLFFDGDRYRLLCWVIMPNHVHVLFETFPNHPLDEVMHSWKSYTSHEANKFLCRKGIFWLREYFDRYVRDDVHLAACVRYIHENPVKAGLVQRAEDWRFSSVWRLAG